MNRSNQLVYDMYIRKSMVEALPKLKIRAKLYTNQKNKDSVLTELYFIN